VRIPFRHSSHSSAPRSQLPCRLAGSTFRLPPLHQPAAESLRSAPACTSASAYLRTLFHEVLSLQLLHLPQAGSILFTALASPQALTYQLGRSWGRSQCSRFLSGSTESVATYPSLNPVAKPALKRLQATSAGKGVFLNDRGEWLHGPHHWFGAALKDATIADQHCRDLRYTFATDWYWPESICDLCRADGD